MSGWAVKRIADLEQELVDQKAITELAVKGLRDIYSNELTNSVASKIAGYNLSEIERLSK
jgi:hypothetical protein